MEWQDVHGTPQPCHKWHGHAASAWGMPQPGHRTVVAMMHMSDTCGQMYKICTRKKSAVCDTKMDATLKA